MDLPVGTGLHLKCSCYLSRSVCGHIPKSADMWPLGDAPSGTSAGRTSAGCLTWEKEVEPFLRLVPVQSGTVSPTLMTSQG